MAFVLYTAYTSVEDEYFLFAVIATPSRFGWILLGVLSAILIQITSIEYIQLGFQINESFGIEFEYFQPRTANDARFRN